MDPVTIIGLVTSTITLIEACETIYKTAKHLKGIPTAFSRAVRSLEPAELTLRRISDQLGDKPGGADRTDDETTGIRNTLIDCEDKAKKLHEIFQKTFPEGDSGAWEEGRYATAIKTTFKGMRRAGKVENLAREILEGVQSLTNLHVLKTATSEQLEELQRELGQEIQLLKDVKSSISDENFPPEDKQAGGNGAGNVNKVYNSRGFVQGQHISGTSIIENQNNSHHVHHHSTHAEAHDPKVILNAFLRSLSFDNMDSRKLAIASSYRHTCDWVLEDPVFIQWRNRVNVRDHHAVLWVKGNAGAGKSTLMKHILESFESSTREHFITTAYFFNARGFGAEKTFLGLLMSVVRQLLRIEPFRNHFLQMFESKSISDETTVQWTEIKLKDSLITFVKKHPRQRQRYLLFVDALDECINAEVEKAVIFLGDLSSTAVKFQFSLNICLSSRHYPKITPIPSLSFEIDRLEGHLTDIHDYVTGNLACKDTKTIEEISERANGMFMWAVLVVKILNDKHTDGNAKGHKEAVETIPEDIDRLFLDVLGVQDPLTSQPSAPPSKSLTLQKQQTIMMLQWVLLTKEPLSPAELYFAVISGSPDTEVLPRDHTIETDELIRNFIQSTSKGLIEVQEVRNHRHGYRQRVRHRVQFIHQTIPDFLERRQRLRELDPTLGQHAIGESHSRLAECCWKTIIRAQSDGKLRPPSLLRLGILPSEPYEFSTGDDNPLLKLHLRGLQPVKQFPFLKHALQSAWYHAERAQMDSTSQLHHINYLEIFQSRENERKGREILEHTSSFPYILARCGYINLLKLRMEMFENEKDIKDDINIQGGDYGNALQAGVCEGSLEIVQLLIKAGADVNAQGGPYRNALEAGVVRGSLEIVQLLIKAGVDVNAQGGDYGNALQAGAVQRSLEIVQLLIRAGADVNAQGGKYGNALQAGAAQGSLDIVQLLIKAGADVSAQGGYYGNVLQAGVYEGSLEIVQLLIKAGVDVNAQGGEYGNALQAGAVKRSLEIVQLLIRARADVNAQGGHYGNALQAGAAQGSLEIVQLLIKAGADVNAQGGQYGNALQAGAFQGSLEMVQLLIKAGADVNAQGGRYGNALEAGVVRGSLEMVQLLIKAGADVNAQGGRYGNALDAAVLGRNQSIVRLLRAAIAESTPEHHSLFRKLRRKLCCFLA